MVVVDLKSVERSSRIRVEMVSCSNAVHGELSEEKETKARRRRERGRWRAQEMSAVDLESLDGRKTGIGLHDGNDTATGGFGRRRRHYCDVQHRKMGGGCMTGGVHV